MSGSVLEIAAFVIPFLFASVTTFCWFDDDCGYPYRSGRCSNPKRKNDGPYRTAAGREGER